MRAVGRCARMRSDQPGSRELPAVRGSGASVEGTTMRALVCAVLAAAISGAAAGAQELPPQVSAVPIPEGQVETAVGRLDEIVADARRRTGVPGIAAAVVSGGAVAFIRGYGVREAAAGGRWTRTPCSSSPRCPSPSPPRWWRSGGGRGAALGRPPDTDHLPGFALSDPRGRPARSPCATSLHRSGLRDHGGDLLEDIGYDRGAGAAAPALPALA